MAITTGICDNWVLGLTQKLFNHNAGNDTFKFALYVAAASLDHSTTVYSATNELSDASYPAGGLAVASLNPLLSGVLACLSWSNFQFNGLTGTFRGSLMYDVTASNKAVFVLDFGGNQVASNATVSLTFPTQDQNNAIIRL